MAALRRLGRLRRGPLGRLRCESAAGVGDRSAAPADQHRLALAHPQQRDEKHAEVMIDPLKACLGQTAGRAQPALVIERNGFRLDAADQKKHDRAFQTLKRKWITSPSRTG